VKVSQSSKLADVCYDIRGPVLDAARRLEEEGRRILKLNIGNPAPFGFEAPDEIVANVVRNLPLSEGYSDSQGVLSARTAIVQHYQEQGFVDVSVEHVWLGNGVSELISFALQALLDDGDEVLIPAPDYPLWTAATSLCGGRAVHYMCDESADWLPDIDDLAGKISPRTKAIVVINPNNPTGAVYPRWVLESIAELARKHSLVVMTDEIYEKILYDGAEHVPFASVAPDLFTLTFNGLSKAYRLAGFRSAWLLVTAKRRAFDMLRRERTARTFAPQVARHIENAAELVPLVEASFLPAALRDDQLRMMFSCCDPRLGEEAQVALVLHVLCGFHVNEIAQAFLSNDETVKKRITRAKKSLAGSRQMFELTTGDVPARLDAVHRALYLLFNEGFHGACEVAAVRTELCQDAIRLVSLLLEHPATATPSTHALLALMCFHAARLPTRLDDAGNLHSLAEQDFVHRPSLLLICGVHPVLACSALVIFQARSVAADYFDTMLH